MRNLQLYRYIDAIAKAGSIRKAADQLAITPSALNRRLLALEEELGVEIFERLGRGVRLSTAGELMVDLFRRQLADVDRLKSQLADLSGLRRGHVSIVCSQALLPYFLPQQILYYQNQHSGVTFSVQIGDGEEAAHALMQFSADIALVFEPLRSVDFQTIISVRQPIRAVMSDHHPLSKMKKLKLTDCLAFPLALPARPYAVRHMLDIAANKQGIKLQPAVESESYIFLRNFVKQQEAITFEIQIGVPKEFDGSVVDLPLELPSLPGGLLHLAQLSGRPLSVAAARFADQLCETFVREHDVV